MQFLDEIFSASEIASDAESLAHWGRDWTRDKAPAPAAIVFPRDVDQVQALVRRARETGTALVPSGGRTGLSGGAVASNGEVVVSFDKMNRILDYNQTDRMLRVEAGVVTGAIHAFAAERDLMYPVDFASSGSSHIGGNIATNAGGIKVIRYGLTRDWVTGLKVVTGAGEVLDCNRGLTKNATGYDLRHLFVGSEGTLGLICEAELRLARAAEPQRVMVLGVAEFADLLKVLACYQGRLTLSAFEFFSQLALDKVRAHRDLAAPLAEPSAFYALLEFDAREEEAGMAAFEACVGEGWVADGVMSQSEAQAASLWQLREGISESIASYTPYKNDLAVKVSALPDFLDDVTACVAESYPDFEVCWYGHIGDGNLHLNILKPAELTIEEFYANCGAISPQIFEFVARAGGSISAEHGVGTLKRDYLHYSRDASQLAALRALKGVFDPDGILNPGKLLSQELTA
ncbi:MAG: FAD-binding oxidoreductase [Pseudomonadota bacterium]